ncbi:MAG: preprotein translocase subunit SecE [Candidatus Omnitrophica bacterium]|nr:preprotein translocase subunit SecE [Candidatus Omnitrophota bacterium]
MSKISQFLTEVKTELGKVSWSSKDDLVTSTIVVLVSVAFLAAFIGVSDFVISKVINIVIR